MSNIAAALKEEIVRLARKEIRSETERFKKTSAQFRSEISNLKKRVTELDRLVSRLNRGAVEKKKAKAEKKERRVRYSAKGLVAMRRRLGFSAADLGVLLGVTAQTIYNWEAEKSQPRPQQLESYAAMRDIGKKQAVAKIQEMAG